MVFLSCECVSVFGCVSTETLSSGALSGAAARLQRCFVATSIFSSIFYGINLLQIRFPLSLFLYFSCSSALWISMKTYHGVEHESAVMSHVVLFSLLMPRG